MAHPAEVEGVLRKAIVVKDVTARYYTSEPTPSRWVAVGTVEYRTPEYDRSLLALLVGHGPSEQAAIIALEQRLLNREYLPTGLRPPPDSDGESLTA